MRPIQVAVLPVSLVISIHASRMGCDRHVESMRTHPRHFNPRIPYGMRQGHFVGHVPAVRFQSTHPVWDATLSTTWRSRWEPNFNPRIPYGMRRRTTTRPTRSSHFNPRIPYGMRLARRTEGAIAMGNFNPRIPYGMRLEEPLCMFQDCVFQSTHPVWDATRRQRRGAT